MSVAVSIVSHGHGHEVLALLERVAQTSSSSVTRVWLTLNEPEPDLLASVQERRRSWPFELCLLENSRPMGFGKNQNQAFCREWERSDSLPYFAVLNPDLDWIADPFNPMLCLVSSLNVGLVYPSQINEDGVLQDSRRELPSPAKLLIRHFWYQKATNLVPETIDWVNAAFFLVPSSVFKKVGGFDENFHMYCEDVEFCLRLQLHGYALAHAPKAVVTHRAWRRSRTNLRHMLWHIGSLLRLWTSETYRKYLKLKPKFYRNF